MAGASTFYMKTVSSGEIAEVTHNNAIEVDCQKLLCASLSAATHGER